jgi:hypothetical protein
MMTFCYHAVVRHRRAIRRVGAVAITGATTAAVILVCHVVPDWVTTAPPVETSPVIFVPEPWSVAILAIGIIRIIGARRH